MVFRRNDSRQRGAKENKYACNSVNHNQKLAHPESSGGQSQVLLALTMQVLTICQE